MGEADPRRLGGAVVTEILEHVPESEKIPRRRRLTRGIVAVGLLGVVFFLFGASGGSYQGKLNSVQKNDNAAYLPSSAESTKVDTDSQLFQSIQPIKVQSRDAAIVLLACSHQNAMRSAT